MTEPKFPKNKRISAMLLTVFAILTSCTLLAFSIIALMFAPDMGNEKYFGNSEYYQTFKFKIIEVTFNDNSIIFLAEHSNDSFGNSMMISGKNATIAYENDAKTFLKEKEYVTVTVAPKFVGSNWSYTIAGMSYGDKIILPFETGKENIVQELKTQSQGISKALLATGCSLTVAATGLIVTIIVVKKKKVFYR